MCQPFKARQVVPELTGHPELPLLASKLFQTSSFMDYLSISSSLFSQFARDCVCQHYFPLIWFVFVVLNELVALRMRHRTRATSDLNLRQSARPETNRLCYSQPKQFLSSMVLLSLMLLNIAEIFAMRKQLDQGVSLMLS